MSSVTFHHSDSMLHPTKNPDEGVYAGGSADSPYLTVWLSTAVPSVPMNLTTYSACSNYEVTGPTEAVLAVIVKSEQLRSSDQP